MKTNSFDHIEPIKSIRKYMAEHGLKSYEFAEMVFMTKNNFYAVLAGRRRMPLDAIRAAIALGLPAEIMLLPFPCETDGKTKSKSVKGK